jgi:hypothetical protein
MGEIAVQNRAKQYCDHLQLGLTVVSQSSFIFQGISEEGKIILNISQGCTSKE